MTLPDPASAGAPRPMLIPPTFPSALAQPPAAVAAPIAPPPTAQAPLPAAPRRAVGLYVWLGGVLILVAVVLVGYFLRAIGPGASLLGMILALVPLAGVLFALRLVDRWEPEPKGLVAIALGWGAIVSVAIALGVDLLILLTIGRSSSAIGDVLQSVIQAPVVEEIAKGLGVLLLFVAARRWFDGPVDGIVYGGLIGAGFAFTENIQYFAQAWIEGGPQLASATFFVRGILSPFAHVMFTAVTGFALGLAARRGASVRAAIGPWIAGLVGAVILHALWNGSALLGDFFALYTALQVPLFLVFIGGILMLRREESRLTRARLGDYAAAGWFTAEEVEMLATGAGRRRALAWARTLPGEKSAVMRRFIADATALAAARQRVISGRDRTASADERALLQRAVASRQALFVL
ncbi:PrsW family intramembrane metalloprotease [Microbacterium sp. cx-55]|uniref:PrsW family intramembrane metalloprotease n=1 Tax=Microbacterium sp. cx-55 TaxID=2875948 RepID=UPI001CC1BE92|nr:PrsW family intramembrane metalloprotease [Microbacterium sp. cx-55]MBZ4488573.1 PrsW family intramembrane metalloprotease [Microbacterium sp. cx-55]UGB36154.1 PrsW family intramembrane metalloprotease [Microbacterium sp. cx-55]